MTRRILTLACLHLAAAVALGVPASWIGGTEMTIATFVGFTAAFALVSLFPVHVELGRHACAVTLIETVLVLALFKMGPLAVVAAATIGEWLAGVTQRKARLKVLFNTAATLGAVMVAAQAFALGGVSDPGRPAAWGLTLLAVAAYAAANHASTSAVLMLAEGRRFDEVFTASATAAALATMVSASLGLAAVVLYAVEPLAPLLLGPLLLAVVVSSRRMTAHRAEHLRFQRLYEATSRTAGLQDFSTVLATVAEESRSLITGAVGFACAPDRHGAWHGVLVGDHGSRTAGPRVVAALRRLVAERGTGEVAAGDLPEVLRFALPQFRTAVVAATPPESLPAVLAVFRELEGDDRGSARAEVLAAFAGHAALTVSNACLYEEAGEALRHQLDLNRRKDDFVAVVSHELRTPLTSMLGAVATLRRIGDRMDVEDRFRLLAIAERQGQRLQRLIEDLLAVAAAEDQEQPGPFEQVDLCALLDELDGDLALASGGRLRASAQAGIRWVHTDGLKLRQLLTNLVENAIKYAPASAVEVRAVAQGESVVISVADHGPGIAEADRERVFERFVQLDQSSTRANGGTGLGLYLCRQLARLLGGPLTVSDTLGGGATFTLTLPGALAQPAAPGEPAPGPAATPPPLPAPAPLPAPPVDAAPASR